MTGQMKKEGELGPLDLGLGFDYAVTFRALSKQTLAK